MGRGFCLGNRKHRDDLEEMDTWKRWTGWDDNTKTDLKNRTEWDDVD